MCKRTMYKRARIPMGTTRMRQQWCPGRFSSPPQKRPGNEASKSAEATEVVTFMCSITCNRSSNDKMALYGRFPAYIPLVMSSSYFGSISR